MLKKTFKSYKIIDTQYGEGFGPSGGTVYTINTRYDLKSGMNHILEYEITFKEMIEYSLNHHSKAALFSLPIWIGLGIFVALAILFYMILKVEVHFISLIIFSLISGVLITFIKIILIDGYKDLLTQKKCKLITSDRKLNYKNVLDILKDFFIEE